MRFAIAAFGMMVVGLCAARPALAQAPDEAQRKKAARELADLAYGQYTAGDYKGAIESFKRADETFHAPTLVVGLAKAHAKAHHLIAARALFDKVIAEQLAPDAPVAFVEAQGAAKQERASVAAAIPTLAVHVEGATGAFTVTIDDAAVQPGAPTELDPGTHQVTVTHDGARDVRPVVLAEGAHQSLDVDLAAGPRSGSAVPGIIALSIGGAGLMVGAIAGGVTLKQASDIKSRCPGGVCPADEKPTVASANAVAAVSTAGFVIAGVGAVVGTVLLVRRPQTAQAAQPGVQALVIGPGALSVRGSF